MSSTIDGLPMDTGRPEYDALPGINWSRLKHMRTSPLHYKEQQPFKETPAVYIGRAIHTLAFEPDLFASSYAIWKFGARRGKAWAEFKREHEGKTILKESEHATAIEAVAALLTSEPVADLLQSGVAERSITWTDDATGIECKGKPDHASDRCSDLKSTGIIEPWRFARHAHDMGYHCQIAFYEDGLRANGCQISHVPAMIVVQNCAPYDVVFYDVPQEAVDIGRAEYRRLLHLLKSCRDTNTWPGVGGLARRMELILPDWAFGSDEPLALTVGGKDIEI